MFFRGNVEGGKPVKKQGGVSWGSLEFSGIICDSLGFAGGPLEFYGVLLDSLGFSGVFWDYM